MEGGEEQGQTVRKEGTIPKLAEREDDEIEERG